MKPSLLIVSQCLPFPVFADGATLRVHYLLKEFSRHYRCHLIAFARRGLDLDERRVLEGLCTWDLVVREQERKLVSGARKLLTSRRYWSSRMHNLIRHRVTMGNVDFMFAEQTFMAQYAASARSVRKVISAVDAISLCAMKEARLEKNLCKRLVWRYVAFQRSKIEKRYFPEFDRVTVVAEEDRRYLQRLVGRTVTVIPNGVDTEYFRPQSTVFDKCEIVFAGTLGASMNQDACYYLLGELFPQLHHVCPWLRFVIAGRSPSPELRSRIPDYVFLKTDVDDIRESLKECLVFVSPVIHGAGIKNTVLQAMSMAIPVAVTPEVAEPIGIQHAVTGFVAKRGGPFYSLLRTICEDKALLDRVGDCGRRHILEKFTWGETATKYCDIFHRMRED